MRFQCGVVVVCQWQSESNNDDAGDVKNVECSVCGPKKDKIRRVGKCGSAGHKGIRKNSRKTI
jgi:hypothetical protein